MSEIRKIFTVLAERAKNLALFLCPLFFSAALLTTACNPCRYCARTCPPQAGEDRTVTVHDSIYLQVTIRDTLTTVRLQPQTVYVRAPDTDTVHGETSYSTANAWVKDGLINLNLVNKDSAQIWVQTIDRLKTELHEKEELLTRREVATVYKTAGFVKFLAWCGGIALLLLLIYIVFRLAKAYFGKK